MGRLRSGFTLVELMIATVILGLILVYVFGTMVTTQKKAVAVDDTVDLQQAARTIADVLERDLRHTGMMVADAAAICGVDNRLSPDWFFVTNWEVIAPGDDLVPNLGATLVGATTLPSSGTYFNVDSLVMEDGTPEPAFDTDLDGTPDSDFDPTGSVILADLNNPERGAACGAVTGIQPPNQLRIAVAAGGLGAVPVGGEPPIIVAVPAIRYWVDGSGRMFRGPYLLANDVEDMQLAYFNDADQDNVVDPNEYLGDGGGPDYSANSVSAADMREVRINLVLRTPLPDPEHSTGNPIATENRGPEVTNDGFRRRVYTSVVRLRNLGRRVQL